MKDAFSFTLREVTGCFFGGALSLLALEALIGVGILLWTGGPETDSGILVVMLTVYFFKAVVGGGMAGLFLFLAPPRGRPYLKSLVLAAALGLFGATIAVVGMKRPSLASGLLFGGAIILGVSAWSWLAIVITRRLFKAEI